MDQRGVDSAAQRNRKKVQTVAQSSVVGRLESVCSPLVKRCRIIATYDAATPSMQIVEHVK